MSEFDWEANMAAAKGMGDTVLIEHLKRTSREFVVLWREADDRKHRSDLRVSVGFLQDRIGVIVEAYREAPL